MASCGTTNLDGYIQVGNRVRSTATFKNIVANCAPFDPNGGAWITIRDPAGVEITYQYGVDIEVEREDIGVYYIEQFLDQYGDWCFKWWGVHDGEVVCTSEQCFRVLSTII